MIVVNLHGGLGNQMFQYAAGREIEIQTGYNVVYSKYYITKEPDYQNHINALQNLSISSFPELSIKQGRLLSYYYYGIKSRFYKSTKQSNNIDNYEEMIKRRILICRNVHGAPPLQELRDRTFVDCYFQNVGLLKNFDKYADELRVKNTYEPNANNMDMLAKIESCNAVCVHIRRGDYTSLKWSKYLLVCDETYYINAFEYILQREKNPIFFIFSNTHDDLKWIENNYNLPGTKVYVDLGNRDFEELYLMYHFKHFILSNSTFSWWAQKLSQKRQIVVAPKRWNNGKKDFSGIYEDCWICV